jgi:hypothetical protein
MTDTDGNSEDRSDAVSVFNGPPPTIQSFMSEADEVKTVGNWIAEQAKGGVLPHEFGVFVRSAAQLDRARTATRKRAWLSRFSMNVSKPLAATSRLAPCTSRKV